MASSEDTNPTTSGAADEPSQGNPPTVPYWHVWTDDDGTTHQTRSEISGFALGAFAPHDAPQWNNWLITDKTTIAFAVLPVGWVADWHENPKPQWIVPLSGAWYTETMDGMRVEMGPGEISFGCDQNSRPDSEGRWGHRGGVLGDAPCAMMVVQLHDDTYVGARPGIFG